MTPNDLYENLQDQINAKGAALYKVKDGEVVVMTRGLLQKLLDTNKEQVVLFIRRGPEA